MAELIAPIVDQFKQLLAAMSPDGLESFTSVHLGFHGVLTNSPEAFVMPGRTWFPDQGEGTARNEVHELVVKLGVAGADPDELTVAVMAYVKAVDDAIAAWDAAGKFPEYVQQVFVVDHDYGLLWGKGSGIAYMPEIHVQVVVEELQ